MAAVAPKSGKATASSQNPRKHRKDYKCGLKLEIGKTEVEGIVDTGASGGNCLDKAVFSMLPPQTYKFVSTESSVCVGINKTPV